MYANEEFSLGISRVTLWFNDRRMEEEYHEKILVLSGLKTQLAKVVVLVYGLIMIIILSYMCICIYYNGNTTGALSLLLTIIGDIIVIAIEVILSMCPKLFKVRGILAAIVPFISYQILLTSVNPGVDYPPGDFAAVVIIAVNGMSLCYNWIVAAVCYVITYVYFFLYAYALDKARYSIPVIYSNRRRVEPPVHGHSPSDTHVRVLHQRVRQQETVLGKLQGQHSNIYRDVGTAQKERERQEVDRKLNDEKMEKNNWISYLTDLPDPVLLKNDSHIVFYNQAMLELLDVPTQSPETQAEVEEKLRRVKNESTTLEEVVRGSKELKHDGAMFEYKRGERKLSLKVRGVKIMEGQNRMMEYIITDLTATEELNRSKAQEKCFRILIATASHDIRGPLNVVNGILEILGARLSSFYALEQLKIAKMTTKRMEQYLKGLSYLQQIEQGKLNINLTVFDPWTAVEEIVESGEISAQCKGIPITTHISPEVPHNFCSDKDKYQLILYFLIRNAIKYTFSGSVTIAVGYDLTSRSLTTVVEDTGIGIDKSFMPKLFVLFAKVDDKDHLNPQGIGLGLYLCKSLTQQLGGNIEVFSVKDRGTKVQFSIAQDELSIVTNMSILEERKEITIPPVLLPVATQMSVQTMKMSYSSCFTCDCKKILIVDDDPFNTMVLSSYLATMKLKADEASNGEIALSKVLHKSQEKCCKGYKIIFMDINMPVMDGVESTKAIIRYVKERKIPPVHVVAVTAAAQLENAVVSARYKEIGFKYISNNLNAYPVCLVQKPVPRDEFSRITNQLLQE